MQLFPLGKEFLPDLDCACASVRRAARLVTQLYGHEMGTGIEPSQYSLLTALNKMPGCAQAPLGRALGLDKTTLSRNLQLMKRNGWIKPVKVNTQRERGFELTGSGEELLARATPGWKRAQQKLRSSLGSDEWESMHKILFQLANSARQTNSNRSSQ